MPPLVVLLIISALLKKMNKKIIEDAKKVLAEYQTLRANMRNYDYAGQIRTEFSSDIINQLYDSWLEIECDQSSLATDKKRLLNDINLMSSNITARLNQFEADPALKSAIMRNIKSIKSIIDKNL